MPVLLRATVPAVGRWARCGCGHTRASYSSFVASASSVSSCRPSKWIVWRKGPEPHHVQITDKGGTPKNSDPKRS